MHARLTLGTLSLWVNIYREIWYSKTSGAATGFQNPSSCDVINGSELFPSFIGLPEYSGDVGLPPVWISSCKLEHIAVARIYLVAPGLVQ